MSAGTNTTRDTNQRSCESSRRSFGWLAGRNRPILYYDPRSLSSNATERATWHAKVVVVDETTSLVTSANFTEWAQQRNVEAGVLVHNAAFGRQLCQQFEALVQSKAVLEVPGFR